MPRAIEALAEHLTDGQTLVLRSTVYPGVTALVDRLVRRLGRAIDVAFCPERIAEGKAMTELFELPQIVSGTTDAARPPTIEAVAPSPRAEAAAGSARRRHTATHRTSPASPLSKYSRVLIQHPA